MDILIHNMNFNLEYIKGLGKNRDNLFIKKKIEDFIKKNHNEYFNDYRILLNLQLKLNKKKISKVYHPIRVSYYSTFFDIVNHLVNTKDYPKDLHKELLLSPRK